MGFKITPENKKAYIGVVLLLLFWVGFFVWWNYEFPSGSWRYKLTVTVETPEGIKTGSAVRQVNAKDHMGLLGVSAHISEWVQGEAVVVDMGQGKYLFAIMDVDGSYRIVFDVFPYQGRNSWKFMRYYESLVGQKATLRPDQYPMLVTFKDIKDPKTVTQVDANNLAAIFGTGVKLKDITIEMTDEPVTNKIDGYLRWLSNVREGYLDGSFSNSSIELSNALHYGYFKRGE